MQGIIEQIHSHATGDPEGIAYELYDTSSDIERLTE